MKIISKIFINILFVLLLKCSGKSPTYPTLILKEEINTGFKPLNGIDISFGIKLISKDSSDEICYLNGDGDLVFYDLKKRNNSVIPFKNYLRKDGIYNGTLSGQTLFFIYAMI